MYHDISPTMLYREYETRVAAAIRNSDHARSARQEPRGNIATTERLKASLAAWWSRVERRLQPAEEGFVA